MKKGYKIRVKRVLSKRYISLGEYYNEVKYQVQKKVWWWPFWISLLPNPFDDLEMARQAAERAWGCGDTEIWWHSDYWGG